MSALSPLRAGLVLVLCLIQAACISGSGPAQGSAVVTVEGNALVITDATIFQPASSEPLLPGRTLVIRDGLITSILPASQAIQTAPGVTVFPAYGYTVLPGLIDVHVHLWDEAELPAYLASGVTTVRNMSGMAFLLDYARQLENGTLTGPRLFTTGPILNSPGPNAQINHQLVTTAEEAREAVRWQHAQGYRELKVYSNLNREAWQAIREEAGMLDMRLTGHPPEGRRDEGIPYSKPFNIAFDELLDTEFSSLEHMESLVWHALYNERDETAARVLARKIAAAGIPVDATLVAHRNLLNVAASHGAFLQRPGTELLNPVVQATERQEQQTWAERDPENTRAYADFYLRALKIFHEEGVILVTGSDAGIFTNIPGASLLDEIDLFIEAGLSPADTLSAATLNGASVLGQEDRLGRVEAGFQADLVIVAGNPLADPSLLRQPAAVVMRGELYAQDTLAELYAQARNTNAARSQNNIIPALIDQGVSPESLEGL